MKFRRAAAFSVAIWLKQKAALYVPRTEGFLPGEDKATSREEL